MTLAFAHARLLFVETARIPSALLFNIVFPTVLMFFFVVPNSAVAGNSTAATAATMQLTVFAVLNACLLNFGVGVAEERSRAWDSYVRTLPAGPSPRMAGRVLNGMAFAVLAIIPVALLAPLLTEAVLPPARAVLATLVVMLASLPFLFGGFAIGYRMSLKAAFPAAQGVMFPLAFGGGLFFPPEMFPSWLDMVSMILPTRAARELALWAGTGGAVPLWAIPVLFLWTLVAAALAVWAYRRDEGQRYT